MTDENKKDVVRFSTAHAVEKFVDFLTADRLFTPGPWTTEPHGNTVALYAGRSQELHGLRLMNLDDGDRNFRANARLICAAPALFKALEDLVACIDETRGPNADAALHKAKELLEKIESVRD